MTHTRIGSCRKVAVVEGRTTFAIATWDKSLSIKRGHKVYLVTWKSQDRRDEVRQYLTTHVCSELIE